ncbi:MAG: DUF4159 domain-containing protein [Phycisphaera sp.]|nr:DUF4159 domain-containing protein [Phycisphaera sp.]
MAVNAGEVENDAEVPDAPTPGVAPDTAAVATPRPVTDEDVRLTIDALVQRIYALQNDSGHWDAPTRPGEWHAVHWGGKTALATYALLTAGQSYQDARLRTAVDFLRRIDLRGTYARACRSHVWAALPDTFSQYQRKDVAWLVASQHPTLGYHNYTQLERDYYDNSATQYGVLGVWEGAKRGVPVPLSYWQKVEQHFLRTQLADGAWEYRNQPDWSGSRATMVTAGLACLHITQEYLHADDFREPGVARTHPLQQRIDAALDWLAGNYVPGHSVGGGPEHYYMYGIERVGLASGYRYLNGRDWYRTGARWIIDHPGNDVVELSFSLLFLVRGRVPVLVNKLQIPGYDWNNRPRDAAHLAEWVSDEAEHPLNWQIVTLDSPVNDWLTAPLLYVASHEPLALDADAKAKIKRYIDSGGMLVTTADAGSTAFTASVRDLLAELYPAYPARPLTADDELMNVVFKIADNPVGATVVHNGVRPLAIHLPSGDASWTLHANQHDDPFVWRLLTNAYYFATEMGRNYARLDTPIEPRLDLHADRAAPDDHAAPIDVVRARYAGNWNPEPLAWDAQATFMHNNGRGEIAERAVDLDAIDTPAAGDARFVHVAGTDAVRFTPKQVDAIQRYADRGGVILFENVGGMGPFTESVIEMLMHAYRDDGDAYKLRPLSLAADVLTGEHIDGAYDLAAVTYRPYTVLRIGKIDTPRLMTVMIDGEPRILVAADDLSFGMLGQRSWGVFGYSTASSRRLVSNITLWATQRARPTPPTPPSPTPPPVAPPAPADGIAEAPHAVTPNAPSASPSPPATPAPVNATATPTNADLLKKGPRPGTTWF